MLRTEEATNPILEIVPAHATASRDCFIVPGPPTSTMCWAPLPLVFAWTTLFQFKGTAGASADMTTHELEDLLGPVRGLLVVDQMVGSKLLCQLELLVARRSDDGSRARGLGDLESEDRDAASPLWLSVGRLSEQPMTRRGEGRTWRRTVSPAWRGWPPGPYKAL